MDCGLQNNSDYDQSIKENFVRRRKGDRWSKKKPSLIEIIKLSTAGYLIYTKDSLDLSLPLLCLCFCERLINML